MKNLTVVAAILYVLTALSFPQTTHAQQVIKPGSVIYITVLGNPELSQTVTVNKDGTTNYPVLGSFDVSGMTAEELNELLTQVVSRMVDRPRVFVSVSNFRFVKAQVKGAVLQPGEAVVKYPADIPDVVAAAGVSRFSWNRSFA